MGVPSRIHVWVWPFVSGLLAVAIYAEARRSAVEVNADGWAYWQGAQSIADGRGYRYFSGDPIVAWPPLYSLYLSLWIRLWGPEAFVLAAANAALIFLQAVAWTKLCRLLLKGQRSAGALKYVAIYVALTTSLYERGVLAHNLFYAILPVFIGAVLAAKREEGRRTAFLVMACASGVILAQSHISGLVYVAAGAMVIVFGAKGGWRGRAAGGLAVLIAPILGLMLIAWRLGQLGSHPIETGRFTIAQNLQQACDTIGAFTLPNPGGGLGFLCPAIAFVVLGSFALASKANDLSSLLAFVGVALLLLTTAFSVTWLNGLISEPRHLLIVPLVIVPVLIAHLMSSRAIIAPAAAALIFLAPAWRTLAPGDFRASGRSVPLEAALSPLPGYGKIATIDGKLLVGPNRWEEPQGGYSSTGAPQWSASQAGVVSGR